MLYKTTPLNTCKYTGTHNKEASPDLGQIKNASIPETDSQTKQQKKKRRFTNPGAFRLAELFENTVSLKNSYLEISLKLNIIERSAKRCVAVDIENGFITKKKSKYKCLKYKTLLSGINEYHLTGKGKKYLNHLSNNSKTPPTREISSKEDIAKGKTALEGFSKKLTSIEKRVLDQHGFDELTTTAPKWWFKNLSLLEKCLKLLRRKQSKGFKCVSELKFISMLMKREGIGFRKKVAEDTHQKIHGKQEAETPQEKDVIESLNKLKTQGLDVSPSSLENLLRNGLSHLKTALTVLKKYIEWNKPIKSINGMLSWIVGQKDPLELLKPIEKSPLKQISKLKHFFSLNISRFNFSKPSLNVAPSGKIYIEFLIHQKAILSSVVKLYKKMGGEWKCLTLEMGRNAGNFYAVVTDTIQRYFDNQIEEGFKLCH